MNYPQYYRITVLLSSLVNVFSFSNPLGTRENSLLPEIFTFTPEGFGQEKAIMKKITSDNSYFINKDGIEIAEQYRKILTKK